MDKEIIINGIDVSKCRFYKEGLCCLSYSFVENGYDCVECSEYNDCDYKQLQRKTTECEKNEKALDDIKECIDELDWTMLEYTYKRINDIIDKAKDNNNETPET